MKKSLLDKLIREEVEKSMDKEKKHHSFIDNILKDLEDRENDFAQIDTVEEMATLFKGIIEHLEEKNFDKEKLKVVLTQLKQDYI